MKKTGRLKQLLALILAGALTVGSVGTPVFGADFGDTVVESAVEDEALDGGAAGEADDAAAEEPGAGAESDDTIDRGISEEADDAAEEESGAGAATDDGVVPEESEDSNVEEYTVTLDANGGYFVNEWDDSIGDYVERTEIINKVIPVGGTVHNIVPIMEQESAAATFLGWSLEPDGEVVSQAEEEYVPVDNCVLYAVWEIEEAVQEENEETVDRSYEIIEDTVVQEEEFSEEEAADASSETDESEIGDTADSTPPIAMDGSYIWPDEAEEAAGIETVTTEATAGAEQTAEELVLHDDYGAAIQDIRDQAKIRKETVQVKVSENVKIQMDETGIWDDLFVHTGNPKEGDYLKYSGAYFHMDSCESLEDGTYLVTLKFYSYYDSEEQEAAVDQEVERIVTDLQLNSESLDNYEKIKAIYAFITKQVQYDYETKEDGTSVHKEKFSAYGSIVEHNAVCQGYALMFYRLALEAGIDSRIITSESRELDDGGHAWNIVRLGDLYYLMDTTWDAGKGEHSWGYFLRGKRDFGRHSNNDDQFHDEVFSEQYPLSEHGFEIVKEWGTAPDYSMIKWDNKIISSAAKNGRAKVLIFGREWCPFTKAVMDDFCGKSFPGVDIVFISTDVGEHAKSYYTKIGNEFPLNIPGTYATCSFCNKIRIELEKMMGINDPDGWENSPTLFMINSDNKVVYGAQGYSDIFENIITDYLVNDNAPEPMPDNDDDIYGDWTQIGFCGYNAIWRYYEDGTVRISGKGDLFDNLSYPYPLGWANENYQFGDDEWTIDAYQGWLPALDPEKIKNVIVDENIGNIGGGMFSHCINLETITFKNHGSDLKASVAERWGGKFDTLGEEYEAYFGILPWNHIYYDNIQSWKPTVQTIPLTIYYPENDPTWSFDVRKLMSGNQNYCKWCQMDQNGVHHHIWREIEIPVSSNFTSVSDRSCKFCDECGLIEQKEGDEISAESWWTDFSISWWYFDGGFVFFTGNGNIPDEGFSDISYMWWSELWHDSPVKPVLDSTKIVNVLVDKDVGDPGIAMFSECPNLETVTFMNHGPDLQASLGEDWERYSNWGELCYAWGGIMPERQKDSHLTIYYPANDPTWNMETRRCCDPDYIGRWYSQDNNGDHHHVWSDWRHVSPLNKENSSKREFRFCDGCLSFEWKDGSMITPETKRFCGEEAQWFYLEDGLLYINGKGDLYHNTSYPSCIGWGDPDNDETIKLDARLVKQILVEQDIGNIGAWMFHDCINLEVVTFLNHGTDLDAPAPEGWSEFSTLRDMMSQFGPFDIFRQPSESLDTLYFPEKYTIYYPENDDTWTVEVKNIFGGREKNRWVTIGSDGVHHHKWGDWNPGMTSGTASTPITLLRFCDDCGACEKKDGSIILPDSIEACGEHAQWYLYNSIGLLYLSGSGNLWGKGYADRTFNLDGSNVRQLIVGKDIGNLGANMFFEFYQLSTAIFLNHAPDLKASVASVGKEWENKYRNWEQLYDDMGWMFPDNNIEIFYPADDSSWTTSIKEKITTHNGGTSICIPLNKNGTIKLTSECAKVTGIASATYTSKAIQPVPVVKLGTKTLKSGTDYTVSYKNNTNVGTATVTITGKGNYTGTISKTFTINKAAQTITAKAASSSISVGKTTTVSITGNKGSKSFKSSDTTVATVSSTGVVTAKKVGTVKITATSATTSNYNAASKTVTIKVVPAATASLTAVNQATGIKLTWKKVTGANGYKVYRGSTLIKTITSGSTVTFADTAANTNGTKYTYKVVAKASTGDSTLSKSVAVYRVARPVISSATNSAASKMTVKWGKNAKANGYQIQYSLSSSFASGNKAVTITSASTVSRVIGSLTKGKTYYVRIRTYKTVGSTKYWSEWSSKKSVKISK